MPNPSDSIPNLPNHKLEHTKNSLVLRAFPKLVNVPIQTSWVTIEDDLLNYGPLNGGFYIDVDKSLEHAPDRAIVGGLACGLMDIERERERSPFAQYLDDIFYRVSKGYRIRDARETDRRVVERGLGPELLEFMNYTIKRGNDYDPEDGLAPAEIESALRAFDTTHHQP